MWREREREREKGKSDLTRQKRILAGIEWGRSEVIRSARETTSAEAAATDWVTHFLSIRIWFPFVVRGRQKLQLIPRTFSHFKSKPQHTLGSRRRRRTFTFRDPFSRRRALLWDVVVVFAIFAFCSRWVSFSPFLDEIKTKTFPPRTWWWCASSQPSADVVVASRRFPCAWTKEKKKCNKK